MLFVPGVGSLAYVLLEVVPELAFTRRAGAWLRASPTFSIPTASGAAHEDAMRTDSVATKLALAEECERKGMWAEAIKLYETAAQGIFTEDAALLFGSGARSTRRGRCHRRRKIHSIGFATRIRRDPAPGSDICFMRGRSKRKDGWPKPTQEFRTLCGYYSGFEARMRYALMLLRKGEPSQARALFEDVVKAG